MKLTKTIKLASGTTVPAGTELHFSNEGVGYYQGETVKLNKIPEIALEAKAVKYIVIAGLDDVYVEGFVDQKQARAFAEREEFAMLIDASTIKLGKPISESRGQIGGADGEVYEDGQWQGNHKFSDKSVSNIGAWCFEPEDDYATTTFFANLELAKAYHESSEIEFAEVGKV